jgi:photosystem II stability/assembly factor-like uncharacterized protein
MNIIHNLALLLLFQLPLDSDQALESPQSRPLPDCQQNLNRNKAAAANIIFKSTDGGETWQDISEGLPENLQEEDFPRDGFFANESGVYLRAGNGIYHSTPNSAAPFWKKEIFSDELSIAPGKTGIFAYNYDGHFLQRTNGTSVWSPMYTNFQKKEVRNVFETSGGTVFIGSNQGLFKSTNSGKRMVSSGHLTWAKHGNCYFLLSTIKSSMYMFQAT